MELGIWIFPPGGASASAWPKAQVLRLGRLSGCARICLLLIENEAIAGQKILQVFVVGRLGGDLTHEVGPDLLSQVAFVDLKLLHLDLALKFLVRDTGYDSEGAESKADEAKDERDDKLPHFHWERGRVLRRGYLLLVTREKPRFFSRRGGYRVRQGFGAAGPSR